MKLRNKKTGEIWEFDEGFSMKASRETAERAGAMSGILTCFANSLAELNEEWEDYEEEPKKYWFINPCGEVISFYEEDENPADTKASKAIGDYFNTREEAEKAVEKLKAVKRLKDKGFRPLGYYHRLGETKSKGEIGFEMNDYEGTKQDLDLLFGGEE